MVAASLVRKAANLGYSSWMSADLLPNRSKSPRVAVIGGGVSGLSAAYYLRKNSPGIDIVLYESSDRLGGVIQTLHTEQSIVELGADNFATLIPDALQLSRDIGIESELIKPNSEHRLARIVSRGRVLPIPNGFSLMQPTQPWAILTTPVLSLPGRLRLLGDYFIPARRETSDESLESFAVRRLGREAYERLVEPIIGGIFTADASKLSMNAALPQFVEMERVHGGLIRAYRASRKTKSTEARVANRASGARYDQFVSHPQGMSAWIQAIADSLSSEKIHLNRKAVYLNWLSTRHGLRRWVVASRYFSETGQDTIEEETFDGLIIACPAKPASELIGTIISDAAEELSQIPYADSAVVAMLVDRAAVDSKFLCFGIVVPRKEQLDTLAISFTGDKYPGRAPRDKILLRVFLGGALHPGLLEDSDDRLFERAWSDTRRLLNLTKLPAWYRVVRWKAAMPQYLVGHHDRLERINRSLSVFPGLALAGNAYQGVGIPQCVRSGRMAAEKILAEL
jgi:oxygen-dependent protoporphyrinogen oxidase